MLPNFYVEYHVYDYRAKKGLTIRDLAEESGVSKSQINDIENGNKHPTIHTLCLLSLALNVSPYELFSIKFRDCPQ